MSSSSDQKDRDFVPPTSPLSKASRPHNVPLRRPSRTNTRARDTRRREDAYHLEISFSSDDEDDNGGSDDHLKLFTQDDAFLYLQATLRLRLRKRVEQLIRVRPAPSDPESTEAFAKMNADGNPSSRLMSLEYLVEYTGSSHLHREWIDWKSFKALIRSSRLLNKASRMDPYLEDLDEQHATTDIDKIVCSLIYEGNRYYLVKWNDRGYSQMSWELEHDLQGFSSQDWLDKANSRIQSTAPSNFSSVSDTCIPWSSFQVKEFLPSLNLLQHQIDGLNWLRHLVYHGKSGILADESNLDRLKEVLALIGSLEPQFKPVLLVAPLSALQSWKFSIQRYLPHLTICVYIGNNLDREYCREYDWKTRDTVSGQIVAFHPSRPAFDVLITSFECASKDKALLETIDFGLMLLDEADRVKNSNSILHQTISSLRSNNAIRIPETSPRSSTNMSLILMTANPLQNSVSELFTLLSLVEPKTFTPALQSSFQQSSMDVKDIHRLHDILRPLLLRRLASENSSQKQVLPETLVEVELSLVQKKYYRAALDQGLDNFVRKHEALQGSTSDSSSSRPHLATDSHVSSLQSLNQLHQVLPKVCQHPFLIYGVEKIERQEMAKTHSSGPISELALLLTTSSKFLYLDKLIDHLLQALVNPNSRLTHAAPSSSLKLVIFASHVPSLELLERYCELKGIPHGRIDSSVPLKERNTIQRRFEAFGSHGASANHSSDIGTSIASPSLSHYIETEALPSTQLSRLFVLLHSKSRNSSLPSLCNVDLVVLMDADPNAIVDHKFASSCIEFESQEVFNKSSIELSDQQAIVPGLPVIRLMTRGTYESQCWEKSREKLQIDSQGQNLSSSSDPSLGLMPSPDQPQHPQKEVLVLDSALIDEILEQREHSAFRTGQEEDETTQNPSCITVAGRIVTLPSLREALQAKTFISLAKGEGWRDASFSTTASIDINDPDFWSKVLPNSQ